MNIRHALSFSLAMAVVALAADAPVVPTPQKVLENYKKLVRLTKEPKPIAIEISSLCGLSPEEIQADKEAGPHAMRHMHYYMNDAARRHYEGGADEDYPAGSVIVKEKVFFSGAVANPDSVKTAAVAGMIKGEPGSNPKTQGWEFFYFNRDFDARGKAKGTWTKAKEVKHCAGCHSNAKDMVFARFTEPYKANVPDK